MAGLPRPILEFPVSWWAAAINTVDAKPWTLWMARLFGRRFSGEDGEYKIVGYEWRGKFYFHDYKPH